MRRNAILNTLTGRRTNPEVPPGSSMCNRRMMVYPNGVIPFLDLETLSSKRALECRLDADERRSYPIYLMAERFRKTSGTRPIP